MNHPEITVDQVQLATGKDTREMDSVRRDHAWLACQIYEKTKEQTIKHNDGTTSKVRYKHLLAFGSTWAKALEMYRQRNGGK